MIKVNNVDNLVGEEKVTSPDDAKSPEKTNSYLNRKRKYSSEVKTESLTCDITPTKNGEEVLIKEEEEFSSEEDDFESTYYHIVHDDSKLRGGINILLGSHVCNLPVVSVKRRRCVRSLKQELLFDNMFDKIKILSQESNETFFNQNNENNVKSARLKVKVENKNDKKELFKLWVAQNFYKKK